MRKFFLALLIPLFVLSILFFSQFYQNRKKMHVDENLTLPTMSWVQPSVYHISHRLAYPYDDFSMAARRSNPSTEALLKYVLFSVTYDSHIIAGGTKSLQLRMSPRNEFAKLQQMLIENTIQQYVIKDIEKVKNKYRYVSAYLVAQNNCLTIEKKMPYENKVYMPKVHESSMGQLWQWDVTAPKEPNENECNLSLFIRFCLNRNDCVATENPDKEIRINIEMTLWQRINKCFTSFGTIASAFISILTLVGIISGYLWKRKKAKRLKWT